jgi:tetratricopeptide (TPR) repeat protein
MFEQAEQLLAEREADLPGNLLKARDLFLEGVDGEASGLAHARLAETFFWLGEYSSSDKEKDKYYSAGVEHGKKAVVEAPDIVESHMWYAANMGSHGVVRGIMASLFYVKPIEKHGKQAMEIDENYFHGAPLRLLGRFYHQCPGWPIGAGDMKKTIKLLEQAVEAGPTLYLNHLYLADVLIAKYKKPKAKQLLTQIVDAEPPADLPRYHEIIVAQAKDLLKKT